MTGIRLKIGTRSSLLEDPVTRKMTLDSANADQISFIINLMHRYNVWDFDKKAQMDLERGISKSK